jgi:hypothetical protein
MWLLLCSAESKLFAGSATWASNPSSHDWTAAANWTPATVPNGWSDTATFATSSITSVSIPFDMRVVVDAIVFDAGASAFTISHRGVRDFQYFPRRLSIQGNGIINNSGITQNFVAEEAPISFRNSATAGNLTHFTLPAGSDPDSFSSDTDSFCAFWDTSTAGNATFTLDGGQVRFWDNSTAANAIITVNGGFRSYGLAQFSGNSTAGNSTLLLNGPPSADNQGFLIFLKDASGGTARVVFGEGTADYNGVLVIDNHNAPGVAVGSIEGNGYVSLGSNNLTVGSNERSRGNVG